MERETYNLCSPFIEAVVAIGAYSRSVSVYHIMPTTMPILFLSNVRPNLFLSFLVQRVRRSS